MAIRLLSSESINGALTLTGQVNVGTKLGLPDGGDVFWDGGYGSNKPVLAANGTTMKMYPSGGSGGLQFSLSPSTATFAGIITANSSVSGDYVRMYGSSGTGRWDIYGSGNNLRISENTAGGTGILTVDRGATFAGTVTGSEFYGGGLNLTDVNATYLKVDTAVSSTGLTGERYLSKSVYQTSGITGFLIRTNIASNNYAMWYAKIQLEEFNYNTTQVIEVSGTAISSGGFATKSAVSYTPITIKAFNYDNKVYFWVPALHTYTDCNVFVKTGRGYVGSTGAYNRVDSITASAIPSTGVTNSVDIVASTLNPGDNFWSANGNDIYNDNTANVGIGTASPTSKLDVTNGEGKFCVDSKGYLLTNAFTTCLTVNLNSHTGCYVTLTCFGDWGGHSSAAYRGEFFLQNGANAYSEPGIILRQDDNTSNGTDQIVCQILDPTSGANPKDFEIQIRTTATTGTTSFSGQLTYTVQGKFNSIT